MEQLWHCIITQEDHALRQDMEAFVVSHEHSHFLQTPRWGEVKEFWQWRGILVYRGNSLAGTMSVLVRKLPLGLSLLYAPRGPVCDREDEALLRELVSGANQLARLEHSIALLLDPDVHCDDSPFQEKMARLGFYERRSLGFENIQAQYVMRLELTGKTQEEVFAALPSKTRYDIRLARRKGVSLRRFYGSEEIPEEVLDDFTRLNTLTGQRDGFLPRGKEYFRKVLLSFGADAVLYMAYLENRPIAGTMEIFTGQKAWYLYGASSGQHREAMPNYLLQWAMICHAIQRKCRFYDLRGVPGDLREDAPLYGLYRFKKQFVPAITGFTGLFVLPYRRLLTKAFFIAWDWRKGTIRFPQKRGNTQ